MTKRIIALLAVLAMLLGVIPAMAETVTGTAAAQGYGGEVTVTVTLTDGVITDVTAKGEGETNGIGSKALETLPAAMKAGNTVNVDVMATATVTSKAVIDAAKDALTNAGVNPEDYMAAVAQEKAEDAVYEADPQRDSRKVPSKRLAARVEVLPYYHNTIRELVDDMAQTEEGIKIGATAEAVNAAYGEPTTSNAGGVIYTKGGVELRFLMKDGKVTSIQYMLEGVA